MPICLLNYGCNFKLVINRPFCSYILDARTSLVLIYLIFPILWEIPENFSSSVGKFYFGN